MIGIDDATLVERRRCAEAVAGMRNQCHAYRVVTGDPRAQLPKNEKHWTSDIIDAHIQRGVTTEAGLADAFTEWFQSEDSSCDFWSECDAPEELARIAVEYLARLRP